MDVEHAHGFELDEARERVRALGDYLKSRHGMTIEWRDANHARIQGKYKVVAIDAEVSVEPGRVRITGKDPGLLWRVPAKKYVAGKLEKYLSPDQAKDRLPRG